MKRTKSRKPKKQKMYLVSCLKTNYFFGAFPFNLEGYNAAHLLANDLISKGSKISIIPNKKPLDSCKKVASIAT
jgi:hypothetical protein